MQKRHLNRLEYFMECANTSRSYYINYLKTFVSLNKYTKVLEIGCGEGGNILPFAELNCEVTGIDRSEVRILEARSFFNKLNQKGNFIHADFFEMDCPPHTSRYDVILVHDVIEHIPRKSLFMDRVKQFMQVGGIVFWAFPAWQMPFGGHQQICHNRFCSKLPYVHLLPGKIYIKLLRACGERIDCINELIEIKNCKVTIEDFEKLLAAHNFSCIDRTLWFINPHYEQKFNLRPGKLNRHLAKVKHLRNFFCTSCFYVTK